MPASEPKTPPKESQGSDKPRKRRSARVLEHDPVIAPGFGTRKDLKKLAAELSQGATSLPVEAVEAMMRSRGRGIRDSSEAAEAPAPVSSAWADFMKEEGVEDATSAASNPAEAAPSSKEEGKDRVYNLPSNESRPSKKLKKGDAEGGVLVQAGTLDSSSVGRTKIKDMSAIYHLAVPSRILSGVKISRVFTSCNAAHSIAVDISGTAYGWGRNEAGQLGPDLPADVVLPEKLDFGDEVKAAALGKSHTIFHLIDGSLWGVGANKSGQCGVRTFTDVANYRKCVLPDEVDLVQIACGEDFSIALCSEGHVYSTGSAEFGQLGNGTTGEHFITANKVAFANCNVFTKRSTFYHAPNEKLYANNEKAKVVPLDEDIRIGQISCGKHHVIAVEAQSNMKGRVFSWGCGNYGDLGHGIQADEYFPRLIGAFSILPVAEGALKVAAGASCSMLRTSNGHVYYWGKHRSVGEATMRPKLVDVLANNGHVVTHCAAGNQTVVCSTAGAQTVAWGQGQHGELGLENAKSSAKPTFVTKLEGCLVTDLACGYGHTLYVVRNEDKEDKSAVEKLGEVDTETVQELVDALAKKSKKSMAK